MIPETNGRNSVNSHSNEPSLTHEKIGTLSARAIYNLTHQSNFDKTTGPVDQLKERLNELKTKHESQSIIRRFFQRVKNRFSSTHLWKTNKQLAEKALAILESKGNNSQSARSSHSSSESEESNSGTSNTSETEDSQSTVSSHSPSESTEPNSGTSSASETEDSDSTPEKSAEPTEAEAQYALAARYLRTGVPQCEIEAVKWFTRAAEKGHYEAQCALAECYNEGIGVPQRATEAVKWYTLAAENGYASAQYSLGFCYKKGRGVPQSATEAVKWFTLAAEKGYAPAQYSLGLCYEKGKGVPQSATEAVKWYTLAASQGNALAKTNLDKLNATRKDADKGAD